MGRRIRVGARVSGAVAAIVMGVVGCQSIVEGTPQANETEAPAYRSMVSSSVSASLVTSSSRESQRQQSLTTQAIKGSCGKFASSSSDAVETVNKYVEAFNSGGDVAGTAGPAVEALNHSADETTAAINDKLSTEMRNAFTAYAEAARSVAEAISTKAPTAVYNSRKDQLNTAREKGMQLCRAY